MSISSPHFTSWASTFLRPILGFAAFSILTPNPGNGDTIRATYHLHTYPLLALLTAEFMEAVRRRTGFGYGLLWALIMISSAYLIPSFMSRYAPF